MRYLLLCLVTLGLFGCASPIQKKDLSAFSTAAPRSILIVPIVNKTLDVDAPLYLLTTLPIPITDKGYYVFPVNTTKFILEQEGLYEGERIQQMPTPQLAGMFGADAVLYVTINRWDAQFILISTTITVDFDYRIVSSSGVEIWHENKKMVYQPQSSGGGILGAIVTAALARAAPNYIPLAQTANKEVFQVGPNQLPDGPYLIPIKAK